MKRTTGSRRWRHVRVGAVILALAGGAATFLNATPFTPLYSLGLSGFSGKQGAYCTTCHSGGVPPTVALDGPAYVLHDSQNTYSFTVTGGQAVAAGLDVAVDDNAGTLIASDVGTHLDTGEVTHDQGRLVDGNGVAKFTLEYAAPSTPQSLTMYGAGNSVDLDGSNFGDNAATATFSITVVDNLTSFVAFGQGLAGSGGIVPVLAGVDGPSAGPWSVTLAEGLGGATGYLWVGFATKDQSPFFGGHFYIDFSAAWSYLPIFLGGSAGVAGDGTLALNGFDVSSLAPLTMYLQAALQDPVAARGVSLTNAIELDVRN